jgi:hypothetical protein
MSEMYHEGNRDLQDRFDTRRLADRIESLLVHDAFTERDRTFVSPGTCSSWRRPTGTAVRT